MKERHFYATYVLNWKNNDFNTVIILQKTISVNY